VALPNRVKVPTEFTKFSGQDDTSTVEHIAWYLMQLGEASADEAFRIRYFPLSLTVPAFTWFTSYLLIQSALGKIWSKSFMLIISLAVMRKS
jgi:isoprenylcysteine carboxyl methyltransferase (ICMT) family protein YpbQ